MTQNELWWDFFMNTPGTSLTTVVQATSKMAFFEASVLYTWFTIGYKAGGYIVTFLDKVDPNINIEIGNMIGSTVDMLATVVEPTPNGTSYVDLPVDANGNWIFPDTPATQPYDDYDFDDCAPYGCG